MQKGQFLNYNDTLETFVYLKNTEIYVCKRIETRLCSTANFGLGCVQFENSPFNPGNTNKGKGNGAGLA